jgi:hypothetical protein
MYSSEDEPPGSSEGFIYGDDQNLDRPSAVTNTHARQLNADPSTTGRPVR